jgi:formylglycine-generating enzyme required for sulfatase activity
MRSEKAVPSIYSPLSQTTILLPVGDLCRISLMGDDYSHRENERPAHTVTLTQPFLMQKTEVTQGQWKAVMEGATRATSRPAAISARWSG